MKHFIFGALLCLIFNSCSQQEHKTISISGTIRNAHNNKVSLISFGATNTPIVLDTTRLDNYGKYKLKSLANEEELYAIKIENFPEIWFVNDAKEIIVNANLNEYKTYKTIGSSASEALHNFLQTFDSLIICRQKIESNIDTLIKHKSKDSLINIAKDEKQFIKQELKNFCTTAIGSTNSAALKYFFLFYTNKTKALEETEVYRMTAAAQKQFPKNEQISFFYSSLSAVVKTNPKLFLINEAAFNFELNDTATNKLTLKTFAGKFLLMNFYDKNTKPNALQKNSIEELYKQYKQKQFEVLNISLDSSKQVWLKDMKKDSVGWKNTIDTLRFNSAIAKKYYITSLPYNILINPSGKIIAIDVNGDELKEKLKEVLK